MRFSNPYKFRPPSAEKGDSPHWCAAPFGPFRRAPTEGWSGTVPFFRGGFTLIEMLIVISILMILAAAAANVMRPALDGRRIREAARAVNVYLSSARNRAMETGRPCGVILRRFGTLPCAMNADQCEVPPCYCGDTEQSTAQVTAVSGNVVTVSLDVAPIGLVRRGDLVQLNSQGPLYIINDTNPVDANGFVTGASLSLALDTSQGQMAPWSASSPRVPYRIFRSPMKGAATPLQLPAAAVVDLQWSGIDTGFFGATAADVTVLFSPNGSVSCIYYGNTRLDVVQPVFLLIGKREKVSPGTYSAADPATWANWQDLTNFWVAINPQTGLVTTDVVARATAADAATGIPQARLFARDAQGMGGK